MPRCGHDAVRSAAGALRHSVASGDTARDDTAPDFMTTHTAGSARSAAWPACAAVPGGAVVRPSDQVVGRERLVWLLGVSARPAHDRHVVVRDLPQALHLHHSCRTGDSP